jgi:NAD(P)-dependent dehydrogenase (short-subunit alcohol dehydrogenase family)
MRVFVAGATGVIGVRLVPLLVAAGHEVAGMTRSPEKAESLRRLGAEPFVCDVFDRDALGHIDADVVIDQLTDLPDDVEELPASFDANDRMRTEGTRNLIDAAGGARVLAQSIAWPATGKRQEAVEEHERMVLDRGGVVIRYGQLYGPGTYYEDEPPDPPRVHVDEAARRTMDFLDAEPGIVTVVE